ncbi:MAG TPA: HAD family hydrolase [Longimicrobiales bacterium]|nr:HAD family hydrolase [Longimicrobiales bacterium]
MNYKAVLLDIDGTLIDSNDAHARAWVDAGKEFGYDIKFEQVRWLIGMGGDKVLPEVTGLEEESKEGEKILARRGEIFREHYLPKLRPFDGTRELLQHLSDDGYKLVVATSASEEDLQGLLQQAGIEDLIDKAANSDDAEESKPAPDIVEAAMHRGKVGPGEAIMIGDTPYDIGAATRAGVPIIAFRSGGWDTEELRGAVAIYEGPAEMLARYSSSPLRK